MPTNRNQIRADAVELAVLVNRLICKIQGYDYYVQQMYHSVMLIGSNLTSLRNSRGEVSVVRRLNIAIDACSELMFAAKVLTVEGLIKEENYKLVKKQVQSIERRMLSSLSE